MAGAKTGKKKAKNRKKQQAKNLKIEEEDSELRHQQYDEWIAISAIYQEDCTLISMQPFMEYSISIHPHNSAGDEEKKDSISIELFIRYIPGYPFKPPKLRLISAKGLEEKEISQLQESLLTQASSISRDGRVMVHELVESAQDYLSEKNKNVLLLQEQPQGQKSTELESQHSNLSSQESMEVKSMVEEYNYPYIDSFESPFFDDWLSDDNDVSMANWKEIEKSKFQSLKSNNFKVENAKLSSSLSKVNVIVGKKEERKKKQMNDKVGESEMRMALSPVQEGYIEKMLNKGKKQQEKVNESEHGNGEKKNILNQIIKDNQLLKKKKDLIFDNECSSEEDKDELNREKNKREGNVEEEEVDEEEEEDEDESEEDDDEVHSDELNSGIYTSNDFDIDIDIDDDDDEDGNDKNISFNSSTSVSEFLDRLLSGNSISRSYHFEKRSNSFKTSSNHKNVSLFKDHVNDDDNDDDNDHDDDDSLHLNELNSEAITHTIKKDLLLAHLLRMVTSAKGQFPNSLPFLSKQLQTMNLLPPWISNRIIHQPQILEKAFSRLFSNALKLNTHTNSNKNNTNVQTNALDDSIKNFWNSDLNFQEEEKASVNSSRYLSDFEEISLLGKGGFGHVVLCTNKIDGRKYAIKKIKLKENHSFINSKILREVTTLSRLQHHNVVRYYQAWFESGVGKFLHNLDSETGSEEFGSISQKDKNVSGSEQTYTSEYSKGSSLSSSDNSTFLYIQMEYCPRTLRQMFECYSDDINTNGDSSSNIGIDKELNWRVFHQILEGLIHIHSQGVIHRDLTPNNIFFDTCGDVKIGDFGLAKFTNLDTSEDEPKSKSSLEKSNESQSQKYLTGLVGTYYYTAPEIEQSFPHIDEKADMYSLGIILFELFHPFSTAMERIMTLNDLKLKKMLPSDWSKSNPLISSLIQLLISPIAKNRPSAIDLLKSDLLPIRMEDRALNDVLRSIQSGENSVIYNRLINALFDENRISNQKKMKKEVIKSVMENNNMQKSSQNNMHPISQINLFQWKEKCIRSIRDVFIRHNGNPTKTHIMNVVDESSSLQDKSVKLVDSLGNILFLNTETRKSFARWICAHQILSFKRYEICRVYRKNVGQGIPKEYFQADFDIVGGCRALSDAELIKICMEILSEFCPNEEIEIRLNHKEILNAIWNWVGVKHDDRQSVFQLLSILNSHSPNTSSRKSIWTLIRRQLINGFRISESIVDRLQMIEKKLSMDVYETIANIKSLLPSNVSTCSAFDEISSFLYYLNIWKIQKNNFTKLSMDVFMNPSEYFYSAIFFQVHLHKSNPPFHSQKSQSQHQSQLFSSCIAIGGSYDQLIESRWSQSSPLSLSSPPGAAGLSLAIEKLVSATIDECKNDHGPDVLVCSRGGGGLLKERMEIISELWNAGIKADYVCSESPSLTEQYEYANKNGIKMLIIITESALSTNAIVKVRCLDLKTEEDVPLDSLVKYFLEKVSNSNLNLNSNAMRRKARWIAAS